MTDQKVELPYGWIVKQSKSYPDRVYYFNVNTGASTWEFPDLIQSQLQGQSAHAAAKPGLSATALNSPEFSSPSKPTSTDQNANVPIARTPHTRVPCRDTSSGSSKEPQFSPTASDSDCTAVSGCSRNISKDFTTNTSLKKENQYTVGIHRDHDKSRVKAKGLTREKETNLTSRNIDSCKKNRTENILNSETGKNKRTENVQKSETGKKNRFENIQKPKTSSSEVDVSPFPRKRKVQQQASEDRHQSSKRQNVSRSPTKHTLDHGTSQSDNQSKNKDSDKRDCIKRVSNNSPKGRKVEVKSRDFPKSLLGQKSRAKSPAKSPHKKRKISPIRSPDDAPNKLLKPDLSSRRVVCSKPGNSSTDTQRHGQDSDTRKVVKSLQQQEQSERRKIKLKTDPVKNTKLLTPGNKPADLGSDLIVSATCVDEGAGGSPVGQLSDDSGVGNVEGDGEGGPRVKLYVGDKDKLLSIQSWIDNLQEGSDSPAREFYAKTGIEERDVSSKSSDCSRVTAASAKIRTDRGWPGELKPSRLDDREIVPMEVDTWVQPEETATSDDLEEPMDMDLVLLEVRQEIKAMSSLSCDIAMPEGTLINQRLLIVIDTNILITNLHFLEDMRDHQVKDHGKPVLYIPWIVLQELDRLKEKFNSKMPNTSHTTQTKARRAIGFLKTQFGHPRVVGQSPQEASVAAQEFSACCNDDAILQACLHCQKLYPSSHVLLLTNDINLINKATVSNVKAFSRNEIMEGLKSLPPPKCSTALSHQASTSSSSCFSPVVPSHTSSHRNSPQTSKVQSTTQSSAIPVPSSEKEHCDTVPSSEAKVPSSSEQFQKLEDSIPFPNPKGTSCMTEGLLREEKHYTEETLVDDVQCKLKTVLKEALGKVLETEMKKAYDDIWLDIMFKKPPWTLRDILECWKKHWIAVFGLVFNRQLEKNVLDLRECFLHKKGLTMQDMVNICDQSLPILWECMDKNSYGEPMLDITCCVQAISDLCHSIVSKTTTVQSVSSLDTYLKSKLLSGKKTTTKTPPTSPDLVLPHHKGAASSPQATPIHISQPITASPDTPIVMDNETPVMSEIDESPMKPGLCTDFVNTVISPFQPQPVGVPPEVAAGELLQNIWQFIYKYCDVIYQAVSGTMTPEVRQRIEAILNGLVPAAKELRVLYTGLLELPVQELTVHEDKFVALCTHCMTFFKMVEATDISLDQSVTPTQFLMLFTSPQHRHTLVQFQSQLDDMLRHLYGCLNTLYPDD